MNIINRIYVVSCSQVSGFERISELEGILSKDIPWKELKDIKKPASLAINDRVDNGTRNVTTKLTFYILQDWMPDARRLSFLCDTVDGDRYLIGTGQRPYPVITQQQVHPEKGTDNQLTEVVVEWKNSFKTPKII
ncbi:MAG: hypothetical protein LKF06_00765 [Prevotella sp.]|jgi:hypothetical protein|nr:hypothetical protein [Prevotella sp.]